MPTMLAHSARLSSLGSLPKYVCAAVYMPLQPSPKKTALRYHSMISSLSYFFSNSSARNISTSLRCTVTSLSPVRFLMSCWVIVEPPKLSRMPRNMLNTAPTVRYQSTPLWS